MEAKSIWHAASKDAYKFPVLSKDIEVDVAIIGGGITGITAALHLINQGKTVAVLEAGEVGGYTTSSSTGNLYIPVQSSYHKIVSKYDEQTARAIAHSRKLAIDFIENTIQIKNIDCNFSRRPWFLYTNDNAQAKNLEKEVETLKKIEINIDYTSDLALDLKFKKAARLEEQARFNPMKYVRGLANNLQEKGCLIFENARVLSLDEKENCVLQTATAKVIAKKTIIATHTPIGIYPVQLFIAPYRSYAIAAHAKDLPEGHFWNLSKTSHAICTHAVFGEKVDTLIVAGNHHKTGQEKNTLSKYKDLQNFFKQQFDIDTVDYQWSAQHYQAADYKPYIGIAHRFKKHVYMATGYFADGLVYGTLAGIILGDLVSENDNPMFQLYNAKRVNLAVAFPAVIKENFNVMLQYFKDYPIFGSKKSFENLQAGEGKIVEIDREKWAVCRDKNNELHMVSAVCTHMKCIVAWNNAENSWDCPCHGSRFSPDGQVLEGPAMVNLKPKKT